MRFRADELGGGSSVGIGDEVKGRENIELCWVDKFSLPKAFSKAIRRRNAMCQGKRCHVRGHHDMSCHVMMFRQLPALPALPALPSLWGKRYDLHHDSYLQLT